VCALVIMAPISNSSATNWEQVGAAGRECRPHNKRMQPDFGELTLASAADARRYVSYHMNAYVIGR